MQTVRVVISDALFSTTEIIETEYDSNSTLKEVFNRLGHPCAEIDLSKYFKLGYELCYSTENIPYIINEGIITWLPVYANIKVSDFLNTFKVESIDIITGIPQAGGPDTNTITEMWNLYYPIIDQMATVLGFSGGMAGLGAWIKSRFKKETPPTALFDIISSRDQWNHNDLAHLLELDAENAKQLIRSVGYVWDSHMQLYVKSDTTDELIRKLSEVSWYKHG